MSRSTLLCFARIWTKHEQETHDASISFSGLMKFLLQLTWERLSDQACLLAGSVSFQSRSQSMGYRDVVYTLPMESNTSKLLTAYTVQGVKEASVLNLIRDSFTTCWLLGGSWSAETWPSCRWKSCSFQVLARHLLQLISPLNSAIVCATHGPGRWRVSSLQGTLGKWLFWCLVFGREKEGPWLVLSKPSEELVRARKSTWLNFNSLLKSVNYVYVI